MLQAEAPLVGTGVEAIAAKDSGAVVISNSDGIVDYVGVSESDVVGVNYKGLSIKVAGLPVPAGALTRVRVPQIGDEFFLGDENFTATPTAGSVYVPDTDGRFKAGAEGAGFAVKVEYETNKIMGQVNDSKKYFCTVLSI